MYMQVGVIDSESVTASIGSTHIHTYTHKYININPRVPLLHVCVI